MTTDHIIIANLSCNGCVNTITKKLSILDGVNSVTVNLESNMVSVTHNDETSFEQLTKTLASIGYPEATEKNGLLTQLKSISSCMTGKFSN